MVSSQDDRELRFIDNETHRLPAELEDLREMMPQNPLDAEKKAVDVGLIEERIGELLMRKKEIEDSFTAAGMEIPNIHRSINLNACRDTASYDDDECPVAQVRLADKVADVEEAPVVKPVAGLDELSSQVASITDELMQIEIKMLQAEIADDESEKTKLSMSANALRSRRDELVQQIKDMKSAPVEEKASCDADSERITALEADNRAIRSQLAGLRSDVGEIRDSLRQILEALNLNQDD